MSNIENNRISRVLSAEEVQSAENNLNALRNLFEFTVGLTPDERRNLPKINRSNKLFVQDAITAARQNAGILPGYLNSEEIQKDYTLYEQLDDILLMLETLYEKIRDTQMLAGSEAYSSALMVYRMFKAAQSAGISGTKAVYESLRERFNHSVKSGGETPETDETEPEA